MGSQKNGEGGIRTPGAISDTQHFQCCTISRSATSPINPKDLREHCSSSTQGDHDKSNALRCRVASSETVTSLQHARSFSHGNSLRHRAARMAAKLLAKSLSKRSEFVRLALSDIFINGFDLGHSIQTPLDHVAIRIQLTPLRVASERRAFNTLFGQDCNPFRQSSLGLSRLKLQRTSRQWHGSRLFLSSKQIGTQQRNPS